MRRLLLALAFMLASAVPGLAQSANTGNITIRYDVALEQPTFTYCLMAGARGDPYGEPIGVSIPIETAGSSTTVTAVTALSAPFKNVEIGDAIYVRRPDNVTDQRTVITNADDDTITVNAVVDWSDGFVFSYLDLQCGTGAENGWMSVGGWNTVQMTVEYAAGDMTLLDVVWECREAGATTTAIQVYPGPSSDCGFGTLNTNVCSFALGDVFSRKIPDNVFAQCRVGLAWRTADGGTVDEVNTTLTRDNLHIVQ